MLSVINQHTSNHETSVTSSGRVRGIYLSDGRVCLQWRWQQVLAMCYDRNRVLGVGWLSHSSASPSGLRPLGLVGLSATLVWDNSAHTLRLYSLIIITWKHGINPRPTWSWLSRKTNLLHPSSSPSSYANMAYLSESPWCECKLPGHPRQYGISYGCKACDQLAHWVEVQTFPHWFTIIIWSQLSESPRRKCKLSRHPWQHRIILFN